MANDTLGTGSSSDATVNAPVEELTVKASDVERMINDALNKALGPRLKRETTKLSESVEKIVQAKLANLIQPAEATPSGPVDESANNEKVNLKTLDSRFKAMQDRIDAAEKKAKDADTRAEHTRMQSDLQSAFSKHAGQDNPHLPAYLNMYAGQFRVHEGQTYRVSKNEFGEEQLTPLDQAASDMFSGELKHLVPSQSNGRGLPLTSVVRGQPVPVTPTGKPDIFAREIMHHLAMNDPDMHANLFAKK